MKEFDIEEAKNGAIIKTRDGHEARIICFNKKGGAPLVVLVKNKSGRAEKIVKYNKEGKLWAYSRPYEDLVMY